MRTQRELTENQKQKISAAMRKFHSYRTEAQKKKTSERQSKALLKYWATIPSTKHNTTSTIKPTPPATPITPPIKTN